MTSHAEQVVVHMMPSILQPGAMFGHTDERTVILVY